MSPSHPFEHGSDPVLEVSPSVSSWLVVTTPAVVSASGPVEPVATTVVDDCDVVPSAVLVSALVVSLGPLLDSLAGAGGAWPTHAVSNKRQATVECESRAAMAK